MLIRRYWLLILTLSAICAQAQITQEPLKLESGRPVDREIAGGESHTYQIKLAAGQFLTIKLDES